MLDTDLPHNVGTAEERTERYARIKRNTLSRDIMMALLPDPTFPRDILVTHSFTLADEFIARGKQP